MQLRSNLTSGGKVPFNDQHIEDGKLDVEVLYSGGGNIVLLFAETGFAADEIGENRLPENTLSRQFVRRLSRKVQAEAPGLKLTFSAAPFVWNDALSVAVSNLLQNMKRQRSYQPALRGDAGQSVQIMDISTGFPTVHMEKDPDGNWQPYAAETVAKRDAFAAANQLLNSTLDLGARDYRFALELDDLGRSKDDTSYIAVVHADGNDLGSMIQRLQEKFPAGKNRDYIDYMRWFSESIKAVAQAAQREMVSHLLNSIEEYEGKRYLVGIGSKIDSIRLEQRNGQTIFPIRPLVSGGDDVTFVCDGRIGLDLAVIFLRAFEKYSFSMLQMRLTACAGVAIVKTHYPFARAYDLADELAGNAKQARYLLGGNDAPSALDWHITAGGLYGGLDTMRQREYQVADGSLTLRPIFIADLPVDNALYHRSWIAMQRIITEFQTRWRGHQNKAEGLRDVLRKGEIETAVYKVRYLTPSKAAWSEGKAPYLPEVGGFESNGWQNGYCGYYDALELIDKYLPLQTQEATRT